MNIIDNFSNLAPVSNGENQKIYIELLEKGIDDEDVKNIALTGSYGSGKSSILKRFLNELSNNKKNKYLEISLANFDKDSKDDEKEQSIERSILQQIFYKVSKDQVPYSKLNRTENKDSKEIWGYSFLFFIWIISFFIYKNRDAIHKILEAYDINIQTTLLFGSIIPLLVTTLIIIYLILRGTGKIKLNKLSFQGVNLDIEENKEGSLLNQYIDEILYFFEATDYEVVIIEDLDRHEVTNIFQKLREINILLNSYEKIKSKKKITFIYAVKDSIFTGEERTKFFEMVIPVIPIVNTSNAKDILITKFEKSGLLPKIGKPFLKDISYYIKDLRQLTNIFNEYLVYHESIDTKNQKDLFSMIIYKNFFPQDFALLHNREGELFRILNYEKEQLKEKALKNIEEELKNLQSKLGAVENEELQSVEELKLLYLGKVLKEHDDIKYFNNGSAQISIPQFIENDKVFEEYLKGGRLMYRYDKWNDKWGNFTNYYSDYSERLEIIKNKILEKNSELTKKQRQLQQQLRDVKYKMTLAELLKSANDLSVLDLKDKDRENETWEKEEKDNWQLIKHLVRNGDINEDYESYISYFHEGDLTRRDKDFVKSIKNDEIKSFDYNLDDVNSVIDELDIKDFETIGIVNLDLAEYFFKNKSKYIEKRKVFISFIFKEVDNDFIYTLVEKNIKDKKFLDSFLKEILLNENMKLISIHSIFKSDIPLLQEILIFILDNLQEFKLSDSDINTLSLVLKEHLVEIYDNLKEQKTVQEFLVEHDVMFDEITKELIKVTPLFIHIYEHNLYRFSVDNIRSIMEAITGKNEWDRELFYKAHLTTVIGNDLPYMVEYIDSDIDEYYKSVLSTLEENNLESEQTLLYLLNKDELDNRYKQEIIKKSENKISNILDVENKELWEDLLINNLVVANWDNIFNYYIESEEFDASLFNFLNNEENAKSLSSQKYLLSNEYFEDYEEFNVKGKTLLREILEKNEFDTDVYKIIIESYDLCYDDLELSELNDDKINILIDAGKLIPDIEVYNAIEENCVECAIKFIEKYKEKYLKDELDVELQSEVFIGLLNSNKLSNDERKIIIEKCDNFDFSKLKAIVQFYIEIKEKIPKNIFDELFYNDSYNSESKIALLASNIENFDYTEVAEYLNELGTPYSEILEKTTRQLKIEKEENIWSIVEFMSQKKWIGKVRPNEKDNTIVINRREKII